MGTRAKVSRRPVHAWLPPPPHPGRRQKTELGKEPTFSFFPAGIPLLLSLPHLLYTHALASVRLYCAEPPEYESGERAFVGVGNSCLECVLHSYALLVTLEAKRGALYERIGLFFFCLAVSRLGSSPFSCFSLLTPFSHSSVLNIRIDDVAPLFFLSASSFFVSSFVFSSRGFAQQTHLFLLPPRPSPPPPPSGREVGMEGREEEEEEEEKVCRLPSLGFGRRMRWSRRPRKQTGMGRWGLEEKEEEEEGLNFPHQTTTQKV